MWSSPAFLAPAPHSSVRSASRCMSQATFGGLLCQHFRVRPVASRPAVPRPVQQLTKQARHESCGETFPQARSLLEGIQGLSRTLAGGHVGTARLETTPA